MKSASFQTLLLLFCLCDIPTGITAKSNELSSLNPGVHPQKRLRALETDGNEPESAEDEEPPSIEGDSVESVDEDSALDIPTERECEICKFADFWTSIDGWTRRTNFIGHYSPRG